MKAVLTLVLWVLVISPWGSSPVHAARQSSPKMRRFTFKYRAVVRDLPLNASEVRIWIPLATSDVNQTVTLKKVSGPARLRATKESTYGNHMMYGELRHPASRTAEFTLQYDVTRREDYRGNYQSLMRYNRSGGTPPPTMDRFLLPNRLVPVGGAIRALAEQTIQGHEGVVDRAHALYDYVFQTMKYDKSGTGWGRGDALWACGAKHGNCTDFHSLFIALARSEKIPARFEIGFPLPENTHEGAISGYHCWAEFYIEGPGWVPVDISEARQHPARHDYFFGALDANRLGFTRGRDLTLSPPQDGPPLNYFVYPYAELDGKPFDKVEEHLSFRDLEPAEGISAGHSAPSR